MGNFLDSPKTEKDSSGGHSAASRLQWGYSAMQGWRVTMEVRLATVGAVGVRVRVWVGCGWVGGSGCGSRLGLAWAGLERWLGLELGLDWDWQRQRD